MNYLSIMNQKLLLIFLIFAVSCDQFNAEYDVPLPDNLKPLSHELVLLTYVESSSPKFKGCVHIKIRCIVPTDKIIVNQKNLLIKVKRVRVWEITNKGEKRISIVDHGHDVDYKFDRYTIRLTNNLEKDTIYKVTIDFAKNSPYKISAYNYIPYEDKLLHPDIEHIVYTKMNEIDARTIFPNFDNLDKKTTLKVKIGHDATVKAFTNSEFVKNTRMDYPSGWVMDEFLEIKNPISTSSFGLAVVVDFESRTETVDALRANRLVSPIDIRISAGKKVLPSIEETLQIASRIFLYFSKFFEAPYTLNKLDLVVLPDPQIDVLGYFGLIFLGENDILEAFSVINDKKFSQVTYLMTSKICHAVSAQWIGHSTTMSSWNESWLHVGFNKFLEKFCVQEVFSKWTLSIDQNIINSFLDLLLTEERGYFNPIEPVGSGFPFDKKLANKETISKVHYTIRMLSFIMRSEEENNRLQKSLRTYLKEYSSENSNLNQVWEIFTSNANSDGQILPEGITVQQIMESWLGKKGHPVIKVSRNEESNKIIVTQEPFNLSNKVKSENDQQECWIIPLRYKIRNDAKREKPREREWLKCDGKPLEIEVENGDWILFNLNLHISARVLYDLNNWSLIEEMLRDPEQYARIEFPARMHLISDMFALAEAEKISYELIFNIMKYLTHENSHYCWELAYGEIMKIRSRWLGTKLFKPFKKYILSIVRPIFNREFKSIEEFVKSERNESFENTIVKTMCTFEDPECKTFGEKLFQNWYTNTDDKIRNLVPESLFESIYCLAMKNADEKEWDFLYSNAKTSLDVGLLNALGCSSNTSLLEKLLVYGNLVTRGKIEPAFCFLVFNSLLSNELGYPLVYDFFNLGMNNLSIHLFNRGTAITVEDILAKVYEATKTYDILKKLDLLYSKIEERSEDKAILLAESKLIAEKNISWLQKYEASLLKYFENLESNHDSVNNFKVKGSD